MQSGWEAAANGHTDRRVIVDFIPDACELPGLGEPTPQPSYRFHRFTSSKNGEAQGMRQPAVPLAAALLCAVVAGCASTAGHAVMPATSASMIPRPLVERELPGLLLNVDQVNAAMGTAAMAVTNT